MAGESADLELLEHCTFLIYPFLHTVTEEKRQQGLPQLEDRWQPWWARLDDEALAAALDDTYFFLPYIREVIYPETTSLDVALPGLRQSRHLAQLRDMSADFSDFCRKMPSGAQMRLTLRAETLREIAAFTICQPRNNIELPVQVEWVDVTLFPEGIGFLILKVKLAQAAPPMAHLLDLNYYLRLVYPPTVKFDLPSLKFGQTTTTVREMLDFLTQELTTSSESRNPDQKPLSLEEYLKTIAHGTKHRYSDSIAGQTYGERCQLLSYACVNLANESANTPEKGNFPTVKDRVLFEFASCLSLGDAVTNPMWIPSLEQRQQMSHDHRFSFWQCWRGMALKETTVFLATEDIAFNKKSLPHNIENDYLPLYLYTLHQKYQLFRFSNQLMRKVADVESNLTEVRNLMDEFTHFRNRYWFSEVTRKPLGSELYRKFQDGLGVPDFYALVSREVKEIQQYYEELHRREDEQRSQRLDSLMDVFTFIFVPLSTVIGIFGMTFFSGTWWDFVLWCVLVSILSGFIRWLVGKK